MAETFNDAPTAARDAGVWDPVCTSPCLSGGHEACPYSPSLTRNPRVQTGNSDRGSLTSKPSFPQQFQAGPSAFPRPEPPPQRRQQRAPARPARLPSRGRGNQVDPQPPAGGTHAARSPPVAGPGEPGGPGAAANRPRTWRWAGQSLLPPGGRWCARRGDASPLALL